MFINVSNKIFRYREKKREREREELWKKLHDLEATRAPKLAATPGGVDASANANASAASSTNANNKPSPFTSSNSASSGGAANQSPPATLLSASGGPGASGGGGGSGVTAPSPRWLSGRASKKDGGLQPMPVHE